MNSCPGAQVCRAAGYYGHALAVAQAAHEPEWALDILLEDCAQYDEALDFLRTLPRQQAAAAITRHGKVHFLLMFSCWTAAPPGQRVVWAVQGAFCWRLDLDCRVAENLEGNPPCHACKQTQAARVDYEVQYVFLS